MTLGVLVEGEPYLGLVPFAARGDLGALWIHASRLARHAAGLFENAPFAALIHGPERAAADPFQVPRVSLRGKVLPLAAGATEFEEGRRAYLAKLPAAERNFQLGDFTLYLLAVDGGRFVAGFGRAYNLSLATLRAAAGFQS